MRSRFNNREITHITISVPVEMKRHIEQIAAKHDMSVSALCREVFRVTFRKEIAKHEVLPNSRPGNGGSD